MRWNPKLDAKPTTNMESELHRTNLVKYEDFSLSVHRFKICPS